MSKIKTFRKQLAMGLQEKINLSTADGLTGYKIKKFQLIGSQPGADTTTFVGQIFTVNQEGSITSDVNFNDPTLIAVSYFADHDSSANPTSSEVIFDDVIINQDIFINITDPDGGTNPGNFYLELEQFKLNLNESTFATLKNLRSNQQQ